MSEALSMETEPAAELQFTAEPSRRYGISQVVARLGDDLIHRDAIDATRAEHRTRFAKAINEKLPSVTKDECERQLLHLSEEIERAEREPELSIDDENELDMSHVVRPELIVRHSLTGITIPRMIETPTQPDGRWTLYSKSDGGRRRDDVSPRLNAEGMPRLWVSPVPPPPLPDDVRELCRWSLESRRDWQAGKVTPTTLDVVMAVAQRIDLFVELPPSDDSGDPAGHGLTLALWVVMSYCYPAFAAVPYLYLAGPAGSGKTRTMDLLGRLVFRPMWTSNTTAANIFRTLHARGGVLLLDEAERLRDDRSPDVGEIRSVLLSGYRRGGRATRLEPCGESFRSVNFDCYDPKLLACIRGLPPALSSRCISVRLTRAAAGSPRAARSMDHSPDDEQAVRDLLHCWALEHANELFHVDAPTSSLSNRDAELWEPLLKVAAMTGDPSIVATLIEHAAKQVESDREDATPEADPLLLDALHRLSADNLAPSPGDVLETAKDIDPDCVDEGWSARRVSTVLRRYGFKTTKANGRRVYQHLTQQRIADIAARYGYPIDCE
jgi:hypothetical protein